MAPGLLRCGLAMGRGGGALLGHLIGQHLLDSIAFWSGQGCELFNACLGSVPWHKCPQGCRRSSREDLCLVLVTLLGTLPPPKMRKRDLCLPRAGSPQEALVLLCFLGTWSVCEESRETGFGLLLALSPGAAHGLIKPGDSPRPKAREEPDAIMSSLGREGQGAEGGESHVGRWLCIV